MRKNDEPLSYQVLAAQKLQHGQNYLKPQVEVKQCIQAISEFNNTVKSSKLSEEEKAQLLFKTADFRALDQIKNISDPQIRNQKHAAWCQTISPDPSSQRQATTWDTSKASKNAGINNEPKLTQDESKAIDKIKEVLNTYMKNAFLGSFGQSDIKKSINGILENAKANTTQKPTELLKELFNSVAKELPKIEEKYKRFIKDNNPLISALTALMNDKDVKEYAKTALSSKQEGKPLLSVIAGHDKECAKFSKTINELAPQQKSNNELRSAPPARHP